MHVNEFEAKTIYEKNFAIRREVGLLGIKKRSKNEKSYITRSPRPTGRRLTERVFAVF